MPCYHSSRERPLGFVGVVTERKGSDWLGTLNAIGWTASAAHAPSGLLRPLKI
jgi:hypothetical protein